MVIYPLFIYPLDTLVMEATELCGRSRQDTALNTRHIKECITVKPTYMGKAPIKSVQENHTTV